MSEVRRPPRPSAPVKRAPAAPPAAPAAPPSAPSPRVERPRTGPVPAGQVAAGRPRSSGVPVTAETDELARAWRRDGAARRPAASTAPTPDVSRRSRLGGRLRRHGARGAEVAAEQLGNVTLRLQTRLKERAAAQRRLSAIVWARRAGYVLIAAVLAWVVLASPVLALDPEQVEVTGFGTVVEPADVAEVVAAHEGQSLATLPSSRLADELREVPGVRDATVERVWPRGLVIELVSREPVAAVPADGGFDLLDSEATRVGHVAEEPDLLPVVTVPVGKGNERILEAALGVVNQLPVKLRNRVEDISATSENTVTFVLRNGPVVDWGSAEDSALKARVLQVLLKSDEAADVTEIDVSAPTLPTTKSA